MWQDSNSCPLDYKVSAAYLAALRAIFLVHLVMSLHETCKVLKKTLLAINKFSLRGSLVKL